MKNLVIVIAYMFVFFSCQYKEESKIISRGNPSKLSTVQNQKDLFKNLKLPFSSSNINFITDSLGYYIYNKKDYIDSDVLGINLPVKKPIIPIGKLKYPNFVIYIYGYGKIGEELLQPIIMAKTYDRENKLIDSLELQKYQSWDYELQKTFVYNKNNNIEVFENTIAYELNDINEEGIKTSKHNKYFLDKNGHFIKINNKNPSKNSSFNGTFSVYVETEQTSTGKASITYNFSIKDSIANLNTNTYHEPINCNGKYRTKEKENILELYYNNGDDFCKQKLPNFIIKYEKGKYLIKGVGNEATNKDWLIIDKDI
ncbi:hypothetical protein [Chryseobacterium salviniae]|uniref:Lipoprotein n=1 Tax=Chryseobacterium salviniae TaxID=3101750 RepID=A0ABU6HQY4_9FLAO|nr:hypothetical protein [Chryseobacterium sp. T9W2-O]MEC3875465.1 hypothetical protein [Chryseobacterium sp. T9W2-O]